MKNTQNKPNNIIDTMKELGRTHMGKGELDLRLDWYNKCGSFLTLIETFDLKIARGEKLNSYDILFSILNNERYKFVDNLF